MQRRPRLDPGGKCENLLRPAVLVDGEIGGAEIGDDPVFFRRNGDADTDEIGAPSKQRLVSHWELSRPDDGRECDRDDDSESTEQRADLMHVHASRAPTIVHATTLPSTVARS